SQRNSLLRTHDHMVMLPSIHNTATTTHPSTQNPATVTLPSTQNPAKTTFSSTQNPATVMLPSIHNTATTTHPSTQNPATVMLPSTQNPATTTLPSTQNPATVTLPSTQNPTTTTLLSPQNPAKTTFSSTQTPVTARRIEQLIFQIHPKKFSHHPVQPARPSRIKRNCGVKACPGITAKRWHKKKVLCVCAFHAVQTSKHHRSLQRCSLAALRFSSIHYSA
uniref:Uncharacterized protein n=1 Tax=Denticeps clupeoides TaxID=299321 RepID=A0AAY4C4R8_9TELE